VLLEAGADPKAKNMWGDSVVKVAKNQQKAEKPGIEEVIAVLIDFGAIKP